MATIKRVPKAADLAEMTDAVIKALIIDPNTTPLVQTVLMRELDKRDALRVRQAKIEEGLPLPEMDLEARRLGIMRRTVKTIVQEFAEGVRTAAQASWEIHKATSVSYKWAERVLEGGYEMHLASGVEVKSGVQAADQRRNLIHPQAKQAWKIVTDGTIFEVEEFAGAPAATLTPPPPPPSKLFDIPAPPSRRRP
jgi:hypothetical protein